MQGTGKSAPQQAGEWLALAELDTAEAATHSCLCILQHNTLSGRSRSQHQSCNRTVPKNLVIPPLHGQGNQ